MTHYEDFDEYFEATSMEHDNDQFLDLVSLHMGQLQKTVITDWLCEAFEAGRRVAKTPTKT